MVSRVILALTAALLATSATSLLALPTDRNQPIEISSDRALRDDKKGLTIYEGDVTINQGTIHIKADKVTVITTGKKVSKIVCIGVPAYYQQLPNKEDGLVIARANTIEYILETDIIQLIDDASLEQEGATLRGERIDYDLKKEVVNARGDTSGKQRVQMVIPPSQQKEAE